MSVSRAMDMRRLPGEGMTRENMERLKNLLEEADKKITVIEAYMQPWSMIRDHDSDEFGFNGVSLHRDFARIHDMGRQHMEQREHAVLDEILTHGVKRLALRAQGKPVDYMPDNLQKTRREMADYMRRRKQQPFQQSGDRHLVPRYVETVPGFGWIRTTRTIDRPIIVTLARDSKLAQDLLAAHDAGRSGVYLPGVPFSQEALDALPAAQPRTAVAADARMPDAPVFTPSWKNYLLAATR